MNVRKRGLALLMCICMIFTLLPFSAFADGTSEPDVVYGTYDENGTTWTQKTGLTAVGEPYTNSATGADVTYSKTATPVEGQKDTYNITLKIESKTSSTAPGASAIVLVIDISTSMYQCTECGRSWENGQNHERGCSYRVGGTSKVSFEQTRLYAARNAAVNFVNSYAGAKENAGRYLQIVSFQGYAYKNLSNWMDVSNASDRQNVIGVINALEPVYKGNSANGTNLEQGLSLADECISNAPNGIASDKKFAVVLTDGEPNKQGSSSSQWKIKSKTDAAASSLKSAASVYTVCFGAESTWSDELGMNVGPYLSGTVASNPSNAFNAKSAADLNSAFENIFASIEQGLSSGFAVTDPMGEYIQLQDASLADCTISNGTITWTPTAGTTTDNADGSKTYTYTLTYTVKLDTSADGFVDNQYYPTNGITTLAFKDGDNNITRDFNVPGVKGTAPRYKVTYEYAGTVPTGAPELPKEASYKAGEPVKVAPAPTLNGYTFSGWSTTDATVGSDGSFTMPSKEVKLTGSWTLRSDLSYTVHYYWNGTNDKVAEDKTVDDKTFNETVTETPVSVNGYTPVSNSAVELKIGTSTNEITFYYYKNVELEANSDTVTYDGEEHSVSGFTGAPEGADFSAIKVGATGTEAETYPANFADNTVGTVDATGKYIVTKTTNGNLTINPIGTVTVTIKGNHDSKVYNGTEQSVTGYTVKISDPKYTEADFKFTGDPKASRTDVGTTPMGLNAHQFENKNSNFKNVTFVIENDGYVEVTKRTVTLTSETASKPYDGTPLTKPEVTVTGDGFVDGEVTDIKATGSVTNVSDSPVTNTIVYTTTDKFVAGNYNITKSEGTLTITKSDKLTVSATGYDGKYDGQTHNGNVTATEGATLSYSTDNGKTWTATEPTIKNVGEINVIVKASMANYSDATAKYTLKVTPRTVTLTSETASKPYDGTPLTKPEVTVTGDGFVDGEVTDIKATGSVTNVSDSPVTNTIVYTTTDKFVAGNYNITKSEGTLTITPLAVTVTAKDYTKYVGEKDPAFEATVTGTINNDTIDYTISRDAGETVGTYTITPAGAEAQGNYTVTYKTGTLTIKERPYRPNPSITDKITVEITGNSDSVVYDGTEHSVKDYTVKISDSRYTEKDFTFSGKALASGINAGTYEMGLKADQFKNTNARFTNVEFIIKADGVLTITQRPLTITAGSAEGIAPVTCDKYTVEGLATGDKVDSVKITGIQSEPGESPNVASDAVIKNAKGEDVTANYKITYVNGVLKAIEVLNKEIHFNYVIGYTDGTIRPNNDISRAEVATIFFRLLTDEAREQYTTTAGNFTDVKAGMWCNRAIATLTNMGIIKGYTDGSFQPNKSITRAELATIIARFAKLDVNTKTFSDINGHWAQKNIELAAGNGWINGYEDGTFRPNNNITRAETFAMINRVLDRQTESVSDLLPTSEMNMWSDNLNENAWYYKDVQEATNYHKCDRVGDSVYEKWTEKVPDIDWASYQI